jgi:hypothetical protein
LELPTESGEQSRSSDGDRHDVGRLLYLENLLFVMQVREGFLPLHKSFSALAERKEQGTSSSGKEVLCYGNFKPNSHTPA